MDENEGFFDERPSMSSRNKSGDEYYRFKQHQKSENRRVKKHSHKEKYREKHRSDRERYHSHHRKRHRTADESNHSKGNLLESKQSDSCKYDVQTVDDLRHSNRDAEDRQLLTDVDLNGSDTDLPNNKLSALLEADFLDSDSEEEVEPSPEKRSKFEDEPVEKSDSSTESNHGMASDHDSDLIPEIPPEEVIETTEESDEIKFDDTLPAYYPAIEGCRSVEEFQCLNRIAEGTYGVVYRFVDKRTDDIVALKKLKMEKEKEGFPITSLREINTLLKGQHENIVTVREIVVGKDMDKIFIVMDYVEHDLKSLIEGMRAKDQRFSPGEVKCLLKQLLAAVAHLHDNWILHRDLKTSNLLLSHKGVLKVGDFGLAREYGSPLRPYTPIVVTLWYRAPELLLCCKEYTTPIDIWSVGCIFAEFLLMSAVFPGKSEVEQLNRIFKCLGTPTEKIWPGYNKLPAVQKMKFTHHPVSNLRKKFQMLSDLGMNFLLSFLTYDPQQRVTAEDALKHPYFSEVPPAIDPSMFPTWPAKSEFGHKRAASPKAPSGGDAFKTQDGSEDGFRIGLEAQNNRVGAGFSLKF